MLKNGQTYIKNIAVFTPQDFKSMFGHFSTLCNKGLRQIEWGIQSRLITKNGNLPVTIFF